MIHDAGGVAPRWRAPRRRPGLFAAAALATSGGLVSGQPRPDEVAPTAAADQPSGVLEFSILDADERVIPGRLTVVGPDGGITDLFPNAEAKPDDLAVRKNVIYTLSGKGRVTVPVGTYTVYASRGLEWSVDSGSLTVREGQTLPWTARLRHEVDTRGWISGDFHLHTLTWSGHGDANPRERVISIIGEGVEFAVATDHNHHADYHPTIEDLHAAAAFTAVTGNEVSVPVGHFNAFPLDPEEGPVDSSLADANRLFALLPAHPNPFGIEPVIQVNHPRWANIDYFAIAGLDPVTGTSTDTAWSTDFDTIEVFNENTGWGYYQAFVDDVPTSGNVHSVLRDWFNLLNRGHRYAAVGNSDSHTVHYAMAGYPRNYVASSTDDPAAIDPVEVAAMLRARRVFTTIGPFVSFEVNGALMGGETSAPEGAVDVVIGIQAASWVDCDRVLIVVNGDVRDVIDVPDTREVVRLRTVRRVPVDGDGWIALLVEGDDPLAPIVDGGGRPVRPLAVTNPVWVDADGDGRHTSRWALACRVVEQAGTGGEVDLDGASTQALAILAAAERGRPFAVDLIRRGLRDERRVMQLAAARAAERLEDVSLRSPLERTLAGGGSDPYLRIALLRALAASGGATPSRVVAFLQENAADLPPRYLDELTPVLGGRFATEWMVLGPFEAPAAAAVQRRDIGPERDADTTRLFARSDGSSARWAPATSDASGFLDLVQALDGPRGTENVMAYAQTWLHAPEPLTVGVTLGTDDGSRVYLNDALVYDDPARRAASPMEHVAVWSLEPGWNRVLFKVENGSGGWGVYFRVLDDRVRSAGSPR